MALSVLSREEVLRRMTAHQSKWWGSYRAMYSSWAGGIIVDPALMVIPMDDHQVHRGDAVFEAIKALNGKVWLGEEHISRLMNSAKQIGIECRWSQEDFKQIFKALLQVTDSKSCVLRVYLSRGPGGFAANPYDSMGPQLYIVLTEMKPLAESIYENGVKAGRSKILAKDPWFARIKSCNYLPNVLMKKEAVDRGLDFTLGFSTSGQSLEGSVENFAILTKKNELLHPKLDGILKGTTMTRAFELFRPYSEKFGVQRMEADDYSEVDVIEAKELMVIGTTLDVISVVEYESKKISDGKVGPVSKELRRLILLDQK